MTTETIQSGSHVIVYSSRDQVDSIFVTPGTAFSSKFGHFKHDDMIGVAWGSKFASSKGRGFVYLLKPTPELWTLALPHRTQILYLPDIAFITSLLSIRPGTQVIEAGTGSGSFTHSLARSVGKKGKVWTYEYHEDRFQKAKDELKAHGLADTVEIQHKNIYEKGFDLVDTVDCVFLDVPAPWQALTFARTAMRKDVQTRICCFSPCIEQVIRTVSSLTSEGFVDIKMFETLTRTHESASVAVKSVGGTIEKIKSVEIKKGKRREGQIREAEKRRKAREAGGDAEIAEGEPAGKKRKLREDSEGESDGQAEKSTWTKTHLSKPGGLARGHTSFLTFATLLPTIKRSPIAVDGTSPTTLVDKDIGTSDTTSTIPEAVLAPPETAPSETALEDIVAS